MDKWLENITTVAEYKAIMKEHKPTIPQLKALCKARDLRVGGKKADLLARLQESYGGGAPAAEEEAVEEVEEADVDAPAAEEEAVEEADVDAPAAVEGIHADGFIAIVRHEDKVLLLNRSEMVADFPNAWDGIYGVGDAADLDAVKTRINDATGISAESLTHVRTGTARGIEFGNRLNEVVPILFISDTAEIEPKTLYDDAIWVDPGFLNMLSPDEVKDADEAVMQERRTVPQLGEMYGDVSTFLFVVKTTIGREQKIAQEIRARLSGTGSLESVQGEIFAVIHPHTMRGYIFVEASAKHHVEKLIGRGGGVTTPLRGCTKVLPGEAPLQVVSNYLEPKAATEGIDVGCIVEIRVGHFKGNRARVTEVSEGKEEVTVELFEAPVPIPITMRADHVLVTERVGE